MVFEHVDYGGLFTLRVKPVAGPTYRLSVRCPVAPDGEVREYMSWSTRLEPDPDIPSLDHLDLNLAYDVDLEVLILTMGFRPAILGAAGFDQVPIP